MPRPTRTAVPMLLVWTLSALAAQPDAPTPPRPGVVGIWRDRVPVVGAASEPEHLAARLEAAGFRVRCLTTAQLADPAALDARSIGLLVLPYGECYPAPAAATLRGYLRSGGNLVALGGRCFHEPIYPVRGGWAARSALASGDKPPRPIATFPANPSLVNPDQPTTVAAAKAPDGSPALRVLVPDLKTYQYAAFPVQGAADYTIVHFRARGDEGTKHLCLELNEADGSRWKAVVPLSTRWRNYELSVGQFVSYATEGRGGKGDFFRVEQARRISFGFPTSLVGAGRRMFELAGVQWRASGVAPAELARGAMRLSLSSDLYRAFGNSLRPPPDGGDIAAFAGTQPFRRVRRLRAAPGQAVVPDRFAPRGPLSGWTASILEDDLLVLAQRRSRRRQFLPSRRLARAIPLLVAPDGRPAAALFLHTGGPYAGGRWACFGVTSRDLFPAADDAAAEAFVALVERMQHGAFLTALQPRFAVHDGRARMQVVATVSGRGASPKLELRARLLPLAARRPVAKAAVGLSLGPHESREAVVLEADADAFDWRHYRIECELRANGETLDRMATSLDVRATLLAICDRFVERQRERGDGKFCGIAFVDNRGTRGLLAAYDLTGRKRYLHAAVAWGNAIIAEQRPDGGYLMGYGYHPDGNECFVADGGEIACGIARLATYVPRSDRQRFVDSLAAYMGYRDSFRCVGGGIGVGWCKRDYGQRPITRLDRITKIFAPEKNIYTIGCTLTAATMYARLTRNPKDNDAAVRDATWWMARCRSTSGGAFVESAVWAHRFLRSPTIARDTEAFLRDKFLPHVVKPTSRWWTTGGGRTVQGLDGLAYYYHRIEKDPQVLATLMRATYHVCSPEALAGIPRILARRKLSQSEWLYLHFAAVSLPDLLEPEIIRKPF